MLDYSVALCTYNGSRYIAEQLYSIINQTIKPSEIVISDDSSTDNTIAIVESILYNSGINYKIIYNQGRHGVVSNFYNAIINATSAIIFTSDQDDVWCEKKAELMLKEYKLHPESLLVFSNGELVDSNLKPLKCSLWESVGITNKRLQEKNWFDYMLKNCIITGSAMCFRQELIMRISEIPNEWLHDSWIAWLAVAQDGLFPCNYKLYKYRQHTNNVVGMSPKYSFFRRFNIWHKNMMSIKKTREIRRRRYEVLFLNMGDFFSTTEKYKLEKCVHFWDVLCGLPTGRITQFYIITRLLIQGDYHKYYTGFRGYLRDIIVALIG